MFKIGEFSKITQVSMRMLRYYDQIGIFQPDRVDSASGYRYYSADQIPRLNRILALRDLGLTVEEVSRLITEQVDAAEIRGMLRLKQSQLQQQLREEQDRLMRVQSRLSQIENEGKYPDFDVLLKEFAPQTILGIREIAPDFDEMGDLLLEAHEAIDRSGVKPVLPGMAVFHDPGYEEEQVDWELGFPVDPGNDANRIPLGGGRYLSRRNLPGVNLMACIVYPGSYVGLHVGYSTLGAWIQANNLEIVGPGREIFLRVDRSGAQGHVTEIQFPVQRPQAGQEKG
jgi:DNA-binding transcriptional MerR regulator